jgi:hypothetical protein
LPHKTSDDVWNFRNRIAHGDEDLVKGKAGTGDDCIRARGALQLAIASATNRQLVLFDERDVALAYGVLSAGDSRHADWLRIGIACDLADVVAGVLAGREGEVPPHTAVLVTGTSLPAAVRGARCCRSPGPGPAARRPGPR